MLPSRARARAAGALRRRLASSSTAAAAVALPTAGTLAVSWLDTARQVVHVQLHRPARGNAMNGDMWRELGAVFRGLGSGAGDVRAVVLSGAGRGFTTGLDLEDHADLLVAPPPGGGGGGGGGGGTGGPDTARRAWALLRLVRSYQDSLTALERCPVPVIAAIHGACVGGGVDLACAADIRLASSDAHFVVKEVELGLAADAGTLQRLPRLLGNGSLVRELAFTARPLPAEEAARHGLVSAVLPDQAALMASAGAMARRIAALSPVAVAGTKANLNFARDAPTVGMGLEYAALWSAAMLQTGDIPAAAMAALAGGRKRGGGAAPAPPSFPPLG